MSRTPTINTYNDVYEHMLDVNDISGNRNKRLARRAIQQAYRDFFRERNWTYNLKRFQIRTEASVSNLTVTYDHTGGSSERLLTFSGSLPANAENYIVRIDQIHYEIAQQVSSTQVTLKTNSNPGEDLASGTACEIYRSSYLLPLDLIALTKVTDVTSVNRELEYVTPEEFVQRNRGLVTSGQSYYYTFTRDESHIGSLAIRLGPPPSSVRNYDCFGSYAGRGLKLLDQRTGTVESNATSVTLAGSGTSWDDSLLGSMIRVSKTDSVPTPPIGDITNTDVPIAFERRVVAVPDSTTITLDSAPGVTGSGKGYIASDPLDLHEGSMLTAFLSLCDLEYARMTRSEDIERLRQRYYRDMREAAAADSQNMTYTASYGQAYRLRDYAQSVTKNTN